MPNRSQMLGFALVTALAGCGQEPDQTARPRLLSVEAASVENHRALEQLGVELASPMPARFVEIEPCVAHDVSCALLRNADRID